MSHHLRMVTNFNFKRNRNSFWRSLSISIQFLETETDSNEVNHAFPASLVGSLMQRQALELSSAAWKRESERKISFTLLNEHTVQEKPAKDSSRRKATYYVIIYWSCLRAKVSSRTRHRCAKESWDPHSASSRRHRFQTKLRVGLSTVGCVPHGDVDVEKIFEQIFQ